MASTKRKSRTRRRARKANPYGFGARQVKRRNPRRHNRPRHNPMGFDLKSVGSQLLWGTAGGVASLTIPGLIMPSLNTGFTGYALNAATAFAGNMLIGKIANEKAGQDFFVGGLVATGLRIFNNFFGSTFPVGLSGLGFYLPNSFPLPTSGTGPFLLNSGYEGGSPMQSVGAGATPAAVAAAAAASTAPSTSDEPARWSKWSA